MTGDEVMRRKEDFTRLYDCGAALRSPNVVLIYMRTEEDGFRGAVVASRKVGNAVRRNRAKRILREAHRRLRPRGDFQGIRIALIARHGAPRSDANTIERELAGLYKHAGLL